METPSLLDSEITRINIEKKLKKDRKWFFMVMIFLIFLNTILFGLLVKDRNSITENMLSALIAYLIPFNIIGFFLGALVSIFPYKKLSYAKKYLRSSLLSIMIIQILMTLCLILLGCMTLLGWY